MIDGERERLELARQGDQQAFSELVGQFQRPVFNLCFRMLGDRYEAEDAAQETFLKAYAAIRRYDPERPFINWLLTIASRHCIDQLRRRKFMTLPIDNYFEHSLPDRSPGPEASLSQSEDNRQIQAVLHTLQPTDRSLVIMKYWHDLSYEEIARAHSLTTGAVKSRLHRARKALALQWIKKEEVVLTNTPIASREMVP